ncbi:hypothetical protein RchiOBHm_Chr2g0120961 [Rosa chinensis]|uniref:Uncharacterized protein n=1 Tax=Rosa chinensis TaxID=74649 RepID=A0A2P6RSE9_ROSCH|nr:hypothetical protein RchiOBHm_Chr2g0120961 [Rosa chinensis]
MHKSLSRAFTLAAPVASFPSYLLFLLYLLQDDRAPDRTHFQVLQLARRIILSL